MNRFVSFIRESYQELTLKVTWPKRNELQNNSTLVLVASAIFALVIFGIDRVFETLLGWFYGTF